VYRGQRHDENPNVSSRPNGLAPGAVLQSLAARRSDALSTKVDAMVSTVSPSIDLRATPSTEEQQPTLGESSSVQEGRIRELEERLERQAVRRDGWTLFVFGFSIIALIASVVAIGFGSRAISESKRNVKAAAAAAGPAVIATPHVDLSDFKVGMSASTFATGQHAVVISNGGTVQHELLVFRADLDAAAYPVDAAGNIIEEGPGITKVSDGANIDPGQSQNRTVELVTAGRYLFVCNLPGHFKAGMFVQVTVT
jgi:uncharacterized cupredoxin-like copper-binding protein